MRRIAFVLAAMSVLVFGLGLAGNAESARPRSAASEDLRDKTTGMSPAVRRELNAIASAPAPKVCTKKTLNSSINKGDIDTFGDCMIKLQDFANYTQTQLTDLNKFVNGFFNCTSYSQLTQYGEDPNGGTFGYVFQLADASQFNSTALDFTVDITAEPFLNFYVLKPTTNCLAFAQ